MAFGGNAGGYKPNTTTDGAQSGKDVFFPSASGTNGLAKEYTMRLFPDETEVVAFEYGAQFMVRGERGKHTYRSCIVPFNNPWDNECREVTSALKEQLEGEGLEGDTLQDRLKYEVKSRGLKWKATKRVFYLNVYDKDAARVKIFKSSWEKHVHDSVSGRLVRASKSGNETVYAKLIDTVQTGARYKDAKGKLQTLTGAHEFDLIFVCKGVELGKKYDFRVGFDAGENIEIPDSILSLPRYNIAGWAEGTGLWPYDALQELKDGGDYYKVAEKYSVALYPDPLPEISAGNVLEEEVEEEGTLEELFK